MIYQSLMWGVYHHNLDIPGGDGPVPLLPHNLVVVEVTNLTNQHDLTPLQKTVPLLLLVFEKWTMLAKKMSI